MTLTQLKKFVTIRNKSMFSSNLQFQVDLEEAGLTFEDIGPAHKEAENIYRWDTPVGTLYEHGGTLSIK